MAKHTIKGYITAEPIAHGKDKGRLMVDFRTYKPSAEYGLLRSRNADLQPVAWSIEEPNIPGDTLRAEALAAGRLIDCVDGKYVARVPGEQPAKSLGALLREKLAASKTPTLDRLENTTERVRPALTWATPVPFDAFKGFYQGRIGMDGQKVEDAQ